MSIWKRYFIAIGINLLAGLIMALTCRGEGCMIIIIMALYILAAIISYLPYLFINTINKHKVYLFLLPSVIMFLLPVVTMIIGLNTPLNSRNLLTIAASILPNTILQLIFFLVGKENIKRA